MASPVFINPLTWVKNPNARTTTSSAAVNKIFPDGIFEQARNFHRQIPGYQISPLKNLSNLAAMIGVGGLWVKDESARLDLRSFKVLGGSFAIYRFIKSKLGLDDAELSFTELMSQPVRTQVRSLTFAAATDGNHGRGVAWAANKLGCQAIIYVHKETSQARIKAIESNGAKVVVVNGTYDDADQPISVVVEPTNAACLFESVRMGDGQPHTVDGGLQTIMAGLACGEPSAIAWKILWDCADMFLACPDYVAAKGMRVYAVPLKGDPFIVSGESGAVTLGALMYAAEFPEFAPLREILQLDRDSQVLLINSEGNTDPDYFRRIVWEGVQPVPEIY